MPSSWLAALEDEASKVLPAVFFEYFRQGSGDSVASTDAAAAWDRYRLVPRVLNDVRDVDLTGSFLGTPASLPIGVAPTTLQRAADPAGEAAMARACAGSGVPMVLSSNASTPFAEVAATGVRWWLQAYLPEERLLAVPMLEAAVASGAGAIVLTVDTPVVAAKRDGDGPSALTQVPPEWLRVNLGDAADAPKARDLGVRDIAWLRELTGLPVVVKGVLHPEDALRAADAGAAAVWVSNHGGRQLARAASTAGCLPGVVEALGGAVEVYVDGGVRDPMSALSALALGADGIFLGRSPLFALSVGGEDGVRRLFSEYADGLTEALRLAGSADVGDVRGLEVREF
ncbi:alpha-hydroxy-acid oxidizing enzyme [Nocardioides marmoriginsengisoli]|uniref:Alpha-hydroxy-acid oxidizing enzyme n=1 Tax=Nocardioides marmoriginsengisoli TaxID=661483 RepID=A0A3N0CJS2_9ACTN|nr:alpha-hydroxy acid oxidase [Nocardioides marmoriginsengisoli]RNL63700.1 alpha-hydroxy-acid oxidizing enzyme [Nocardioides marmoriginsengisoli]